MTDVRGLNGAIAFRATGRKRHAFSLIELLVAMSVASIVLAAALPRLNLARYKADAAMAIAQGVLQQAHRNAVQRQHDVIVGFDITGSVMRVLYDADNDRAADPGEQVALIPLQEGNGFAAPSVGVRGIPTTAIAGSNIATVNGLPSVIFRRDGAASSDLEIYIRAPGSTLDFRALAVVQSTGRVQRFRYSGTAWRKDGR